MGLPLRIPVAPGGFHGWTTQSSMPPTQSDLLSVFMVTISAGAIQSVTLKRI